MSDQDNNFDQISLLVTCLFDKKVHLFDKKVHMNHISLRIL